MPLRRSQAILGSTSITASSSSKYHQHQYQQYKTKRRHDAHFFSKSQQNNPTTTTTMIQSSSWLCFFLSLIVALATCSVSLIVYHEYLQHRGVHGGLAWFFLAGDRRRGQYAQSGRSSSSFFLKSRNVFLGGEAEDYGTMQEHVPRREIEQQKQQEEQQRISEQQKRQEARDDAFIRRMKEQYWKSSNMQPYNTESESESESDAASEAKVYHIRRIESESATLQAWMQNTTHHSTPGYHFVRFLQRNLYQWTELDHSIHTEPQFQRQLTKPKARSDESYRIEACSTQNNQRNDAVCFTGKPNAHTATFHLHHYHDDVLQPSNTKQKQQKQQQQAKFSWETTLQNMVHYPQTHHEIYNVRTSPACLPLLLAGAALGLSSNGAAAAGGVEDGKMVSRQVAVQLNPFLGLSSRCITLGLSSTTTKLHQKVPTRFLYAFDTYQAKHAKLKTIKEHLPWLQHSYPEFFFANNNNNNEKEKEVDYQWLWSKAVEDVSSLVVGIKGELSTTLHSAVWQNDRYNDNNNDTDNDNDNVNPEKDAVKVGMLLFNNVNWRNQLSTLPTPLFPRGSILLMEDFTFSEQPLIVYGCLRQVLVPVYTSWCKGGQWMFLVMEDVGSIGEVLRCMRGWAKVVEKNKNKDGGGLPWVEERRAMVWQLEKDLKFMQGGLRHGGGGELEENNNEEDEDEFLTQQRRSVMALMEPKFEDGRLWRRFR